MRITTLLVKKSTHEALLGAEKSSKMEDDEWVDINVRAKATIILCLSDEVFYNVMNKETTASLWCKMESLYDEEFIQLILFKEAFV